MRKPSIITCFAEVLLPAGMILQHSSTPPPPPAGSNTGQKNLQASYARLPLAFEEHRGQTDPRVNFLAGGKGNTLFLTGGVYSRSQRKGKTEIHLGCQRGGLPCAFV